MASPIRVTVTRRAEGVTTVQLACRCARVTRSLTRWESEADAIVQLRAEHRRMAPACRHRFMEAVTR